jgi:hypothetical protein
MVGAIKAALLQLDRGQRANHAFGHRSQIMADTGDVGSVVSLSHDPSMPDDHQAVLLVSARGFDQPGKAG